MEPDSLHGIADNYPHMKTDQNSLRKIAMEPRYVFSHEMPPFGKFLELR